MKTFISVVEMKKAYLTAGQLVETSGYVTPGDGGGAKYLIKANEAVDGFGNHTLAGTTVAILQPTGVVNVLQFGARGNGSWFDTLAFSNAWAVSNPAPVFVPVRSYRISGDVAGSFYSIGAVTIVTGTVTTIFDALAILESQIVDGSILARIASNEAISGHWSVPATPNVQDADYTFVLGDAGKTIHKTAGGAGETYTIPDNAIVAYLEGTLICIQNDGGGDLSIAITTDTLTGTDGVVGTKVLGDNHTAVIQKLTATTWKYAASDA